MSSVFSSKIKSVFDSSKNKNDMSDAPPRERRPSTSAPITDLKGPVGPGFSRPKHKRTFTGFGAGEIKNVEGLFSPHNHPLHLNL
jgi:hypothetical protein